VSRDARADREACHAKAPLFRLVAAWYGLAHTFVKLGQKEKACDAFAKALEIDPENASIYKDLGLLAAENGNLDSPKCSWARPWNWRPERRSLWDHHTPPCKPGAREEAIALYEYGLAQIQAVKRLQKELLLLYKDAVLARASLGATASKGLPPLAPSSY